MLKRLERALEQEDFWHGAAHGVGVCSLSRKALNILMWSHYADKHNGFVVEFDIPTVEALLPTQDPYERSIAVLCPHQVLYEKARPEVNPLDTPINNVGKQLLTKSADWAYEAEERVIDTTRGFGIHPYDRGTILKSVIAGVNMKKEQFTTLKKLVDKTSDQLGRHIQIFQAKKSKIKINYRLHIDSRPDLDAEASCAD